jgi:quercetin dioxygenase-like cupin family protein
MNGSFIKASDVPHQVFPGMGDLGMISASSGSSQLLFGDLVFAPGEGFNFHRHPNQEEGLYLINGSLEAWIGDEKSTLSAGDSMYLPAGTVHACFNVSDRPAKMFVILSPVIESEELGFELVDVSEEAPWSGLRS